MSSCSTRRGGKQRRQLSMPSSGKPHSLRILLATSLLPATSLSPAPPQAALPALLFRSLCLCRQTLTTQASFNSPPPPPNVAHHPTSGIGEPVDRQTGLVVALECTRVVSVVDQDGLKLAVYQNSSRNKKANQNK